MVTVHKGCTHSCMTEYTTMHCQMDTFLCPTLDDPVGPKIFLSSKMIWDVWYSQIPVSLKVTLVCPDCVELCWPCEVLGCSNASLLCGLVSWFVDLDCLGGLCPDCVIDCWPCEVSGCSNASLLRGLVSWFVDLDCLGGLLSCCSSTFSRPCIIKRKRAKTFKIHTPQGCGKLAIKLLT